MLNQEDSPLSSAERPTLVWCVMAPRFLLLLGLVVGLKLDADPADEAAAQALPPAAPGMMDFARDIQRIFARHCVSCHGAKKQSSGLRLDIGEEALKGSNAGPVIDLKEAAKSRLLHLVAGLDPDLKMPPKGERLSREEIGRLRAWIEQGAKWPKGVVIAAESAKSEHWAFLAPKRTAAPKVQAAPWVRNEIDAFILARLEREGIAPSPEADRVTLIRRLSFDLLGLPPTPGEVEAFVNDPSPDAYEKLVDRLLASPHYGERWGRHWLDLARYADSDGYEKDGGRPFAWRYRNWVIDALNADLPFDRFTIEQLAGDLLPEESVVRSPLSVVEQEKEPPRTTDYGLRTDRLIATGFHRNTLTNKEGGIDAEQFRVEAVVDRVSTTAQVWLGLTVGCARCHDHKYDPISQREFYQLLAFFNSDKEVDVPAPLPGELASYEKKKAEFDKKKGELQAAVAKYRKEELPAVQQKWEAELKLPELRKLSENLRAVLLIEPDKRDAKQKKELTDFYAKQDKRFAELTKAVTEHNRTAPALSTAPTLALDSPRKTHVMIRGDFLRPGVEVQPATLSVLPPLSPLGERARGEGVSASTRLDLAHWLVAPDNPLTSRVIVNWVWHKYFGRGLVVSLEDFGTRGERPSHPELLDWLALEFSTPELRNSKSETNPNLETPNQKPGAWSLKRLHKLIVTSATYRQSSKYRPQLRDKDPLNVLLARQNRLRLEAEILRDNALSASGLLVRTIGGPSVRPPQPAGVSELTYANSARWVESKGPDRYRRGMYTWFQRTSPYPMLMTFDAPDANVCVVRRDRSNTPLQALTLLNDAVFVECAQALARRIVDEEKGGTPERVRFAFRLCLGRPPTPEEEQRLGRLFEDLLKMCQANPEAAGKLAGPRTPPGVDAAEVAAWAAFARTIMNLDEFVTRE